MSERIYTPAEFAEEMEKLHRDNIDPEGSHVQADNLMCELLKSLGYGKGVEVFADMDKWYA